MATPEHPAPAARPAVEGTVLPAGHTLGIPARLADDVNARDAYAALVAAGYTPAELSPEGDDDEYGDDPAQGTGFRIDVRDGGRVLVYHLVRGVDAWHALSDNDRKGQLSLYRIALRAAGWECDGFLTRAVHARRPSPLPEGVTAAQTRGEEVPQGPLKVRMTPQREALDRSRAKADADREAHRAEMDEREAAEARAHGVPVRPDVAARIEARQQQAARLPVGTRVRHAGQEWATSVLAPKGTAVVVGVGHTHADGTFEYKVMAGRDFSRRIGPDNPMDRLTEWNSARVLEVAPPRYEARLMLWGVWDADAELWINEGGKEECEHDAEGLNTGSLTVDARTGRIRR
jgi:hypothetical protein